MSLLTDPNGHVTSQGEATSAIGNLKEWNGHGVTHHGLAVSRSRFVAQYLDQRFGRQDGAELLNELLVKFASKLIGKWWQWGVLIHVVFRRSWSRKCYGLLTSRSSHTIVGIFSITFIHLTR